ncbi:shikimate dehydrogenase [Micromonospora purpureochromogenes]|uniref:Shikimate dehydrogenase n=1 Tax=Micromonospora purpureochromogenes TaxID=47872 RepID=A0ABX2RQX4_9ACTN|nr:shikimate dehydrogenase [Micromonospora purpureochromogenes]NYF58418.1 shikimate dehydrogenase [Micromonospora purpureochromogenes]
MTVHRAAVLGKPIAHSLSPVIHNAGYAAAGLTGWSYTRVECAAAELPALVAGLGPEWAGLSVTMPGKEAALAVADAVSPVAAAVGAANTLVRRPDGSWYADNTDVSGMVEVLTSAGVAPGGTVTVLGAGGTARAALAAAARLGAASVTVVARRPAAVDELRPVAGAVGVALTGAGWADAAAHAGADVVVSTVPKGVADPLAGEIRWRPSTVLFDALYDPWPTPLAASALAAGARVVSGLDLLLAQAVGQFEQFTGVPAPRAAMARALAAHRTGLS